ncbi:MAG: hypothetical protein U0704_14620 [Candidatus Eisenbacteria bacterium]
MPFSRRRFLTGSAFALVAAAGAAAWKRSTLLPWLFSGALADAPRGPLADSTADVLRATVLALLDARVEPGHYVDCFRWRARHVRGARALYERFERHVDGAARAAGSPGFRSAPPALQRRIVAALAPARGWARARRIAFARDEARFARHVVREVFVRFAATDAWVLSGYDAWPGMPRAIVRAAKGEPVA